MKIQFLLCNTLLAVSLLSSADERWITIAESFTSLSGPAAVEYRLFTVPVLNELCPLSQAVSLVAVEEPLILKVGIPFSLENIQIVARDQNEMAVDKVPLVIEVEEGQPPMFDRISAQNNPNFLTTLREGEFLFRVRGICAPLPEDLSLEIKGVSVD